MNTQESQGVNYNPLQFNRTIFHQKTNSNPIDKQQVKQSLILCNEGSPRQNKIKFNQHKNLSVDFNTQSQQSFNINSLSRINNLSDAQTIKRTLKINSLSPQNQLIQNYSFKRLDSLKSANFQTQQPFYQLQENTVLSSQKYTRSPTNLYKQSQQRMLETSQQNDQKDIKNEGKSQLAQNQKQFKLIQSKQDTKIDRQLQRTFDKHYENTQKEETNRVQNSSIVKQIGQQGKKQIDNSELITQIINKQKSQNKHRKMHQSNYDDSEQEQKEVLIDKKLSLPGSPKFQNNADDIDQQFKNLKQEQRKSFCTSLNQQSQKLILQFNQNPDSPKFTQEDISNWKKQSLGFLSKIPFKDKEKQQKISFRKNDQDQLPSQMRQEIQRQNSKHLKQQSMPVSFVQKIEHQENDINQQKQQKFSQLSRKISSQQIELLIQQFKLNSEEMKIRVQQFKNKNFQVLNPSKTQKFNKQSQLQQTQIPQQAIQKVKILNQDQGIKLKNQEVQMESLKDNNQNYALRQS